MQYSREMSEPAAASLRVANREVTPWSRARIPLGCAVAIGTILAIGGWKSGYFSIVGRTVTLAMIATIVFTIFERWPARLPSWMARWVLQVVAVGVVMPMATLFIYIASTPEGAPPFWEDRQRLQGFGTLCFGGLLIAPWMALAALVRQKDALARHQALTFELERSELERQALDARLHLLQAQVAPHFLFNTLANVQALVDAGSPQASNVLRSLIAYLRAAVPMLNEPVATIGQELDLVRAYLELMHMRIPDRLQFELHVDESARAVRIPPTALLTLVENAVRHGIDPTEEGGRIDVSVERRGNRCVVRVADSGAGLQQSSRGLGTGLTTLRERLQLMFGGDAQLRVVARESRGVSAELDIPVTTERS